MLIKTSFYHGFWLGSLLPAHEKLRLKLILAKMYFNLEISY